MPTPLEKRLREELEKHAQEIAEASDVRPESLKEHQEKILSSCKDMIYISVKAINSLLQEALSEQKEGMNLKAGETIAVCEYKGKECHVFIGSENIEDVIVHRNGATLKISLPSLSTNTKE